MTDPKPINCSEFDTKKFRGERRAKTFPIFANKTDEKEQTIKLTTGFLNHDLTGLIANISSGYYSADVVDAGIGSGELAHRVASYLSANFQVYNISRNISYIGIDKEIELVEKSKSKLVTIERTNSYVIQGDCFGGDLEKIIDRPMLIIASQMIFYASEKELDNFIDLVAKRTGRLSIVIAQASGSFLNKMVPTYDGSGKIDNTESMVEKGLTKNFNLSHIKLYYSSRIYFPKNISYEELIALSIPRFEELSEEDQQIRSLIEFTGGTSMEKLYYCLGKNKFNHFIGDLYNHLSNNNFEIKFWNYAFFTVPSEHMSNKSLGELFDKLSMLYLSGNLTSFEDAINESNYEVSYSIFKQGFRSSRLVEYSYLPESFYNVFSRIFKYYLRFEENWQLYAELFNFSLDDNIKYTNYTSAEILKMKNIKYNYSIEYGIKNPVDNQRAYSAAEGDYFHNYLAKKLIGDMLCDFSNVTQKMISYSLSSLLYIGLSSMVLFPVIISVREDPKIFRLAFKLTGSLSTMFYSFFKKHYHVCNAAIHYIKGDEYFLQIYLFNPNNYDSLKLKNSNGETALHRAVISNDTQKVLNLMSASKSVVNVIANIKNYEGKLPLHLACEISNIAMVEEFILAGVNPNAVANRDISHQLFDYSFFFSKIFYLHAVFESFYHINRDLIYFWFKRAIIGVSVFGFTKYFIKAPYPDGLYYLAFINQLNPHENWEETSFNFNLIYKGYSFDTPLSLSFKYNHIEVLKFLIKQKNIDLLNKNFKGETILHFASANNNIEAIDELIALGPSFTNSSVSGLDPDSKILSFAPVFINAQTSSLHIYPMSHSAIKIFILFTAKSHIITLFCKLIFIKIINDDMFLHFHGVEHATPLHYAVAGPFLSDYSLSNNSPLKQIISNSKLELLTIEKLIENGADPNLPMTIYSKPDEQIIPLLLTELTLMTNLVPSNIITKLAIILFYQFIFPYEKIELKPIDLVPDKNSECYKYLKQYTIMNKYIDFNNYHFLDPRYILYKYKIISDKDIIDIHSYGAYRGGSGADIFNIDCNYSGKIDKFAIIIVDYNYVEDKLNFSSCDNIDSFYTERSSNDFRLSLEVKSHSDENFALLLWGVDNELDIKTLLI